jgi:hypothetical protein
MFLFMSFMIAPTYLVRSQRGFTLIEALIYFSLASALIVGAIVSAYPLFTSTERSSLSIMRDLDSAFVFQKVSFLLNGANAISAPASGSAGPTLAVNTSGDSYLFSLASGAIVLTKNGGVAVPLTSSRITIANLLFTRTAGSGGAPDTLTIDFTANGVSQGPYTRYVRF